MRFDGSLSLSSVTFAFVVRLENEDGIFDRNNENQTPNDQTDRPNALEFRRRCLLMVEDRFQDVERTRPTSRQSEAMQMR